MATYTFVGTFYFSYAIEVPFDFFDRVDSNSVIEACLAFVIAGVSYYLGWFFVAKTNNKCCLEQKKRIFSIEVRKFFILLNILTIIIYVLGYGIVNLVSRPGYTLFETQRIEELLKLHFLLLPIAIVTLAFIRNRVIRYLLFIFHFMLYFSASTRLVGLIFFLYALGRLINRNFKLNAKIVILALIGLYFFVWVLSIRYYSGHGFFNNIFSLFTNNQVLDYISIGLNYVTSFSVYGLAYSIENSQATFNSFLVSISPLPLSFHGGIESLYSQRLLGTSPMSVIAIIYDLGLLTYTIFFFFLGVLSFYISRHLNSGSLLSLMVAALFVISILFSIQYNLRGFTRIIYLTTFLSILVLIMNKYRFTLGSSFREKI
jgi:hypothetical protein